MSTCIVGIYIPMNEQDVNEYTLCIRDVAMVQSLN